MPTDEEMKKHIKRIEDIDKKLRSGEFKGIIVGAEELQKVESTEHPIGAMAVDMTIDTIGLSKRDAFIILTGMERALHEHKKKIMFDEMGEF